MSIKDAEDQLIKIFHRNGAQLVKDASDFHPIIGVGIASILGRHQHTIGLRTGLAQFWGVGMAITQDETDFSGDFAQQSRSRFALGNIGGGQHRSDGKPDGCDH